MGLLEQVTGPGDLRDLSDDQLATLASEIRDELVRTCAPRGGHLGPNLGVVELTLAIHRVFDSPRDRVVWDTGHQAYVHKMLTGRATQFDTPAHRGRPVRVPQPGRVRPRRGRELPRLHLAVLCRRARQGLRPARRGPLRRRRDRRRRADRRHGLGGAQQHRDGQGPQARDGRQRQRALLHADRRRPRHPPRLAAHEPALRGGARRREEPPQQGAGRRAGRLRRPPRDEEGHEGRPGPAGHVRGPRPEVRRPDRRPRPPGGRAGPRAGQALRWPGDRPRDDPQGVRLRPRRAQRGRPVPPDRRLRRRDRRGPARRTDLDRLLLRGDGRARRRTPGHRRDHRRDALPGRPRPVRGGVPRADLRRRHRRAARRHQRRRPGDGWHAPGGRRLCDVPQPRLRPGR